MLLGSKITPLGLSITEANSVMLAQALITSGEEKKKKKKKHFLQLDKQFPCQEKGANLS